MHAPVMKLDASLTRNKVELAMSSPVHNLPSGTWSNQLLTPSGQSRLSPGRSVKPGHMLFTRIFFLPNSNAEDTVRLSKPAFVDA